ncbi:AsmA family protein [Chthonobacter albigriseus]|uniref:AsmA family protein n=1 Tax=Chthonobacter albigriseus TaxID=1683161 RepID=UPI0015EF118A|nr:AsmA family protein [Chthonobacter albigriseus]
MRRLLTALGLLLLAAIGAVLLLPSLIASDWIRDRIVREVEAATGLTVSLDGPVSLALFPSLALEAQDVGLALKDATEFARVREIRFGLALTPLLNRQIDITGLDVIGPTVDLALDQDGQPSWTRSESGEETVPLDAEPAEGVAVDPSSGTGEAAGFSLAVRRLTVSEGSFSWADDRTGAEERVEDISFETAISDLSAPVRIEGGFTARGLPQTLTLEVASPSSLIDSRRANILLDLTSALSFLSLEGSLDLSAKSFDGIAGIASKDLRGLASAFGAGGRPPFTDLKLQTAVHAAADRLEATGLDLTLDGMTGKGELALAFAGAKPRVDLRLAVDRLDLDRLNAARAEPAPDAPAGGPASGEAVGGKRAIDLSPLSRFDGGVELKVGEITGSALADIGPLTNATLIAVVKDGTLDAAIGPMTVVGGSADLRLGVKPDKAGVRVDGRVKAGGFDLKALAALRGAALPVTGVLSADVAFAAVGETPDALRASLGAAGSVALRKGVVSGLGLSDAFGDPAADRLTNLEVEAAFKSLNSPVRLTGSAAFRKEPFTLDVTVDPRRLIAGGDFALTAKAASKRLALSFDGTVDPARGMVSGGFGLDSPSLGAALAVLGRSAGDLPPGKVAIFGTLDVARDAVRFSNADFTLAETHLAGDVAVALAGRPKITARLEGDAVDLGSLIGGASGAGAPDAPSSGGNAGGGPAPRRGWSEEPLDISGLRGFDADVAIGANRVLFGGVEAGPARLTVVNEGGKLTVDLPRMGLYDGEGAGRVTLDGAGEVPALAASFRLADVSALPLLSGAAGFTRIEGKAAMEIDLTAAGGSERALAQGLNGKASVAFRDGALRGIDITSLLQSAALNVVTGFGQNPEAKTAFHALTATFAIQNGQVTNDDLRLDGPYVRATGAGRIDVPNRQIGYRVVPTLAAPDGTGEVSFEVPVIIEGSWDAPRIYPDIAGILEDPKAAYDKLRKLGGAFGRIGREGGDLGAVLEGLAPGLGAAIGGGGAGEAGPGQGEADPLNQILEGVLGGRRPAGQPPGLDDPGIEPQPLSDLPGQALPGEPVAPGLQAPEPDAQPSLGTPVDPGIGGPIDEPGPALPDPAPLPMARPALDDAPVALPPPDVDPVEEPPVAAGPLPDALGPPAEPSLEPLPDEPGPLADPGLEPLPGEPVEPQDPMELLIQQGVQQLLPQQ